MSKKISRRELINLAALTVSQKFLSPIQKPLINVPAADNPNILIVVLDAFSAENVPMYGYPRNTTPEISKLLDRAIVYHHHYANGSFTTPGTASILTGVVPWTHQAIRLMGKVSEPFTRNNIFELLGEYNYHGVAYTHNPLANIIISQFEHGIENLLPIEEMYLYTDGTMHFSPSDFELLSQLEKILITTGKPSMDLLFGEYITDKFNERRKNALQEFRKNYPKGLPYIKSNYFRLEDAIDWLIKNTSQFPNPFLGYFHFLPPHKPYKVRDEFTDIFEDISVPNKPHHILGTNLSSDTLYRYRTAYDQTIALADYEFKRLFDYLEESGLSENTWVILTSDHGEIFERGIWGHWDKTLYQPLIHIPLIIFEPGRTQRLDIYDNTMQADLLPTLFNFINQTPPDFTEGRVLPPFSNHELDPDRNVFSVLGRFNQINAPLETVSISLVKDQYKLIYYAGYGELPKGEPLLEMYDLANDSQELYNIYDANNSTCKDLYHELKSELDSKNEIYR